MISIEGIVGYVYCNKGILTSTKHVGGGGVGVGVGSGVGGANVGRGDGGGVMEPSKYFLFPRRRVQ